MSDERILAEQELRRHAGERGARMYVAHHGVVYDVTDCPKWHSGQHEWLHFPGQDLTSELPEAPHGLEVFARSCVKRVGRLAGQPHGCVISPANRMATLRAAGVRHCLLLV